MVAKVLGAVSLSGPDPRVVAATDLLGRPPRDVLRPAPSGGRSRLDLMWHDGRLGQRGMTTRAKDFDFVPVPEGLFERIHPPVIALARAFEADPPPIGDAQVRFRVAPDGREGLWLDFCREGIEALLTEGAWLRRQLDAGRTVELGQRSEAVVSHGDRVELVPAAAHVWLPSFTPAGEPIPLGCRVASFTQPGPEINRALQRAGDALLTTAGIGAVIWCEWGAGIGNLTAWLARRLGPSGTALEADHRALPHLTENARLFFPAVTVGRGVAGFADAPHSIPAPAAELWALDPPRPGFPALLRTLATRPDRPVWVLAWHCHERGLRQDSLRLRAAGYAPLDWVAVDAFPATPFLETVTLWLTGSDR